MYTENTNKTTVIRTRNDDSKDAVSSRHFIHASFSERQGEMNCKMKEQLGKPREKK